MIYEIDQSERRHGVASLEDYLESIRSRRWLVIGCILLGVLGGWTITTMQTDSYEAKATVVVNPTPVGSDDSGRLVAANLERELEVIVGDKITEEAAAELGESDGALDLRDEIDAAFIPGSEVIRVTATSDDPERAKAVVSAFTEGYVRNRVAEQTTYYAAQIATKSAEMTTLEQRRDQLSQLIAEVEAGRRTIIGSGLDPVTQDQALSDNAAQKNSYLAEQSTINNRISDVAFAVSDLESQRAASTPAAEFLSRATLPDSPKGLPAAVFLAAGGLFGLFIGIAAAFLATRLDRSASSPDEVTRAVGAPVVGILPDMGWRAGRGTGAMAMLSDQRSPNLNRARESFRRLRTSVEFVMSNESLKSLLITSSRPGEGKSITAANLAVAMAKSGVPVALISADMRRPRLETLLGLENDSPGLSGYLGGLTTEIDHVLFDSIPSLALIPAGPEPANPGELLTSQRFTNLINELRSQVALVIIDMPPVSAAADASAAARSVDGVLVIVDAKSTSLEELRRTRDDLQRVGAKVVGAVLNRNPSEGSGIFGRRSDPYSYSSKS